MIGTLITIGAGVYVGLYLATKGCTYKAAMKPLKEASDLIRNKCCKMDGQASGTSNETCKGEKPKQCGEEAT